VEIVINKRFLKDLAEIPMRDRRRIEKFVFEDIFKFSSPYHIPNFSKLVGYDNYFKIRFGNYRAGIRIEDNVLVFERILHRKNIYKFYP
jgi:mRNA interferase RelE/StbE